MMVLAGCAAVPAPPPPQATLPAAWSQPLPRLQEGVASTLPRLEEAVADPELPRLVAAAHAASPTLAAAAARVERARASRVAAGAQELPRPELSAGVQQGRAAPGAPVSASVNAGLQVSWELDLFGARRSTTAAAGARLSSAREQLADARRVLAAEVATSLVAVRACVAQRELSGADSASRDEIARLTGLREKAGFSAPAEAALARASAAQGRVAWAAQRAACEQQVQALVELTALPPAALREQLLDAATALPAPRAFGVTQVPADLLSRRPDLRDAAQAVLAAAADRAVADAVHYPQLSLAGAIGLGTSRSQGVSTSGSTWTFGPLAVTWPPYDAGARRANSEAARAEYDAAVVAYQAALRRAVREVESSLLALQSTTGREADARAAAEGFEASLRATTQRQRGGLASLFELEDARRSSLAAQGALIELQRERTQAWINLNRALGGD